MKKKYLMRLRDHAQSLKRRRSATRGRQTRQFSEERAATLALLERQIAFMEAWIKEVKK